MKYLVTYVCLNEYNHYVFKNEVMEGDEKLIYFSLQDWQNKLSEPIYDEAGNQTNDYVTIIDWRKI